MASYKVLQDIEAEDTLIGPLTLRQCIYAAIAIIAIYLSVVSFAKGAPFMVVFTLPFIAFGIFFAFPWSKQQSTEVWALAKVRFILKPRKRIWNQTGARELVTITVPKNVKRAYASSLSPTEVSSRLKALADTIDSRGWAIKNVDLGYYTKPGVLGDTATDRLVAASSLPQEVIDYNAGATEDIFDVDNNPVAQKFHALMTQSADNHRQQLMQQTNDQANQPVGQTTEQPAQQPAAQYWNMPPNSPQQGQQQASPQQAQPLPAQAVTAPQEQSYAAQYGQQYASQPIQDSPAMPPITAPIANSPAPAYGMGSILPEPVMQPVQANQSAMAGQTNPAILELVNNNDLDIATIAREAQARSQKPAEEIVVSLHGN